ncbi:MAG: hypothetical protein HY829_10610 [Actinobacteria bacterium]|nr:hypothetical protein [Actinomycetota bacterium]
MPGTISLSGQLPNDAQHNGLLGWEEQLADKGKDARLFCLVVLDVPTIKIHTDDGTEMPIVRLRHIEPVGWLEDAPQDLVATMTRLGVERSGGEPLPGVDGGEAEVYVTGPEDDPKRSEKLKRAHLTPVQSPFAETAVE